MSQVFVPSLDVDSPTPFIFVAPILQVELREEYHNGGDGVPDAV